MQAQTIKHSHHVCLPTRYNLKKQVHELKEYTIRIYKTCVRPVMTYAVETRAETSITKGLLGTTETRTLNCITSNALRDTIRNEDIRNICEIQDVIQDGPESGNECGETM